jgi:glycosyltransferase involved in cell wall biosynthesis
MSNVKVSLAIPYKQRPDNLRIALEGLAHQTMDSSEFEIVIGAMEYSDEYLKVCREFTGHLNIISVLSAREFNVAHARNLSMRQATGEVIVQMNADSLLAPDALRNLYDRYFAYGQKVCVAGRMLGYGNNRDGDIVSVETRPYSAYVETFANIERGEEPNTDVRFQVKHVIPWSFAWTGFVALPSAVVRECDLFFEEGLRGWGQEDLEWGYRICANGIPIMLREDVYCIDLPHIRNMQANAHSGRANWRRFLRKWPCSEVELAAAFGDVEANNLVFDFKCQLAQASAGSGGALGVVRGIVAGKDILLVGAIVDSEKRVIDSASRSILGSASDLEVLPLAGLCLPYDDASVGECHVMLSVVALSRRYQDVIYAEVARVSGTAVQLLGGMPS